MSPANDSVEQQPGSRRAELVNLPTSYVTYVDLWAIVVGVSKYKCESLNLRYADLDADEFYKLLLSPTGGSFKSDYVIKLTNHEATTANVTKALRSFLKKPGREDLVVIYCACHGTPDFDRPENVYLLTHDTDPDDIAGTALPMREIDQSLRENLLSKRVIIFADTCHSAAIGGGIGRRSTVNETALVNRYLQEVSTSRGGIALLTSAEANEVSFEDAKWGGGHGVFTHYLLKGMQGEADLNQNGCVTVGELFEYVRAKVQEATEHRQHPSIGTNPYDRNLPLAITFPAAQNLEQPRNPTDFIRDNDSNHKADKLVHYEQREGQIRSNKIRIAAITISGCSIAVASIVAILQHLSTLPPDPKATLSPATPPRPSKETISPSPSPRPSLSTPGLIIRYFPQKDAAIVRSTLGSLDPKELEVGISDKSPVLSTNAIWFDSRGNLEDVKLVAESLRKANVPIQSIRPFSNVGSKPFIIEVGADRELSLNQTVLTLQEIRNATEFRR
jgi:uncharacterized caspase-like protein